MIRSAMRSLAISLAVIAGVGLTSVLMAADNDACGLLTKAEIQKETGLMVADGSSGKPIPGVLGRCTWEGPGNSRVIVTLADAQHMGLTVKAQQQSGGEDIKGLGSTAVGIKGPGATGGGYIVSVLDAKWFRRQHSRKRRYAGPRHRARKSRRKPPLALYIRNKQNVLPPALAFQ
jgi:hypothetical protein